MHGRTRHRSETCVASPSVARNQRTEPGEGASAELRCRGAQVWAEVMGAEAALVRLQLVSGTHAIATALAAVLRPGDELLAVAGRQCSRGSAPED